MRQAADSRVPDDDAQWMKVVYRSLDLAKVPNASLYYPQEVVDGQENLFRIIMNRFASGELTAYEYLDGREMFTEQYRVNPVDVLERFHVPLHRGWKRSASPLCGRRERCALQRGAELLHNRAMGARPLHDAHDNDGAGVVSGASPRRRLRRRGCALSHVLGQDG